MLNTVVIVCFVHCQNQRMDAIATVRCSQGIAVDTCLGEIHTLEAITASLADRYTSGVEGLLVDADLETEEAFHTVDGGIVAVGTGSVVCFLVIAPAVVPEERQVVLTDGDDGIH